MSYDGLLPEHEKIRQQIEASWDAKSRNSRKCYEEPEVILWELPITKISFGLLKAIETEENYERETQSKSSN